MGHSADPEYPDIDKLFSITSDSNEVMEPARRSDTAQTNLSVTVDNIRSMFAGIGVNTNYSSLTKLKTVFEDTRRSASATDNSAFDLAHLDINRIQKKLQNLGSKIKDEQLSLNDTRKQILYPPVYDSIWYQVQGADPKLFRSNEEFSRASRYVMKTKIMDMMLQLIFMARHKMKYLEQTKEFSTIDTAFRMAFMFNKMTLIRRKLLNILSTVRLRHDPKYERNKDPFDYVEIYLILHHKALRFHVDFVYLYKLVLRVHEKDLEKHGHTEGLTVPDQYLATVNQTELPVFKQENTK